MIIFVRQSSMSGVAEIEEAEFFQATSHIARDGVISSTVIGAVRRDTMSQRRVKLSVEKQVRIRGERCFLAVKA